MALRRLKDCIAELHDSDNAVNLKETVSISAAENPNSTQQQYVKWDEVRSFLLMAEEALRAKDEATRRAIDEAAHSLVSRDEVDFLVHEISKTAARLAILQQRLSELTRENQSLQEEMTLLKAHIEEKTELSSPTGFGVHSRQQLAEERARTTALENELDTSSNQDMRCTKRTS